MLFISKETADSKYCEPYGLCSSAKLFQSSSQVAQLQAAWRFPGLIHVMAIAIFITRMQYLAETLPRKIRHGKLQ